MATISTDGTGTAASAPSGAFASINGFLAGLIDTATPLATAYLGYKTATTQAKSSAAAPAASGAGQGWQGTVAGSGSLTAQPWFPFAVIGGILAIGGGFLLILLRGRK